MTNIIVQLNPDTPPTGTDLSVVNAARRSFGKRSDWEDYFDEFNGMSKRLRSADKRLLEFLARGMTSDDFEEFLEGAVSEGWAVSSCANSIHGFIQYLWDFRNTPIHDTPFNHTFISFEVKCPLFVHGQLV